MGHKVKDSFIDFFKLAGTSFTTVMPWLWAVIEMRCNESTLYIYPQFKRQYFLQTIENSNLLTKFTTDFTNLSLKLKLVIKSDAKEFHFILNRDNGSFTGQHRISLDPSKSNCLIFWMISFHLIEFIPLINLFQIGIYGMFNLVDIFRRLKQLSKLWIRLAGLL